MRPVEVRRLGLVPYGEAVALQRSLVAARQADRILDQLLLLEHPPVITMGVRSRGGRQHVLAPDEALAAQGIEIHESGRGGDVTFHGPGQLVGYPILDLKPDRCDVHRYVRDLEETIIRVAGDLGVAADRVDGLTGVWVGPDKLAAIGVRISRWVTSHGFAVNRATNLEGFSAIVPCGIADRGVTSFEKLGCVVDRRALEDRIAARFAEVFDREMVTCRPWPDVSTHTK